ncbi:MAG: integrase core domain-containing protein, partial [Litorimonas sp.]
HDGRRIRMPTVIDEYTRECLALPVARRLSSEDVLAVLADLFVQRGPPEHIRSDDGPDTATAVRDWLGRPGVKTAFIEPASPWENGYDESFDRKLRDELFDREVFHTLAEARVPIGAWRRHYDTVRPHSALGYRPPVPETIGPPTTEAPWMPSGSATLRPPSPVAQKQPMP